MREHTTNCAAAKQIFAVCKGSAVGGYSEGWERYETPADLVSPGNEPYGTRELLLKSSGQLLSDSECDGLVDAMDAHSASRGWDQRYPLAGYTREVKVSDMPEALALLNASLESKLLPAAAATFGLEPSSLRVNEALVVKYDAVSGHNALPVHCDFSLLTLNVALSPRDDYEGGGTWFEHSGEVLLCGRGEGVLHPGGLTHCGVPVTRGTRHVLVLFLLSATEPQLGGRLQAIGAAAGTKPQFAGGTPRPPADLALSCAALERAVATNPCDAESWSQLGHNRVHERNHAAAEKCFAAAAKASAGRSFAALCDCAAAQAAQDKHDDALATLRRALELGAPPGPTAAAEVRAARLQAATAMLELRMYEEAGVAFDGVVEEDGDALQAWAGLGVCMDALGQPEAALSCQKQVLRIKLGSGGGNLGT